MMFFLWTNWKSNFPLFNYFSVLLLRVVISSSAETNKNNCLLLLPTCRPRRSRLDVSRRHEEKWMDGGWPWTFYYLWALGRRLAHSDFYWLFFSQSTRNS